MHESSEAAARRPWSRAGRNRMTRWLLTGVFAAVFIGLTGHVVYRAGYRIGLDTLQKQANHRLEVFKASFFSPVERFDYLPDLLARHPTILDVLGQHGDTTKAGTLNGFLEDVNRTAGSAAIYVMNAEGVTIASSNHRSADSFVGKNFSFRPYFKDALNGKLGRFYGVGSVTREPGYFLAFGVRQGDRSLGVVAVKIDLDDIDQRWDGSADQVAVTDDNGIIFLSSNPDWKYRTTTPLAPEVLNKLRDTRQYASMLKEPIEFGIDAIEGGSRIVRMQDGSGRSDARYLALSTDLAGAKWTITIYSPVDVVANIALLYSGIGAGGAAFLVLLGLYVMQVRKRISEKERARQAAQAAHEKLEAQHRELEILSEHLKAIAITDGLTGCYNRRHFLDVSSTMLSAARRHRRCVTVLMIDVDFFKKINDTYGHPAGDEVLKAVAGVCRSVLRESDFMARFGGEEFVVILPDTAEPDAFAVAERLRASIALMKVAVDGGSIGVTVSIGLSEFVHTETSIDKALARADAALYRAKQLGRDRVVGTEVPAPVEAG
ncbi:sensor domain-containing diguanylate cyclase [Noviherbaspirillum sp.]|uniref:sensor domain-containing diguanylate cyclase n=1 Tax=Noviherbaspirillum sp. TaxID=1926288 RepID=UPI002FE37C42